ncbi:MAG: rhodanese-like domain-containing protein [Alphaproteobacteria bacterium]
MTQAKHISIPELETLMKGDNFFLLDVRQEDEFNTCHIPGATHHSLGEIYSFDVNRIGMPIYVICRTGPRALAACNALHQLGAIDVAWVCGGIQEWREKGLPTTSVKE